jgi:hypothetical protein
MNWTRTLFLCVTAFLAVFWQSAFDGFHRLTGAQIDLLPGLMVYTALTGNLLQVGLLAVLGGTCLDSLSANPLGATVLPLFAVGLGILVASELILKHEVFAQFVFGLIASALTPLLTLLLLLTAGESPLLGWGTLWQWLVMSLVGAAVTPLWFGVFEWLHRTFTHGQTSSSSFRPDREIRRGRR